LFAKLSPIDEGAKFHLREPRHGIGRGQGHPQGGTGEGPRGEVSRSGGMADSARGTEVKMGNLVQKFSHFIGERLRRGAEESGR